MINHRTMPIYLIASIIVLCTVFVAYGFMYITVNKSVDKAAQDYSALLERQRIFVQNKTITDLVRTTATDRSRLAGTVVPSGEAVKLIEAIEAVGPQSGSAVSLPSIDVPKSNDNNNANTYNVSLHVSAQGSWNSIIKAIQLIETLPYAVKINRMNLDTSIISSKQTSNSKRVWTLSLIIQAPLLNASSTKINR